MKNNLISGHCVSPCQRGDGAGNSHAQALSKPIFCSWARGMATLLFPLCSHSAKAEVPFLPSFPELQNVWGRLRRGLHLSPGCVSPCEAGWVQSLPWCVAFNTQSLDEFLLYGAADKMTQGWLRVQSNPNLLQTIPCSFSEHLLLFSSSPSKTEKTQLNWRGLSELHFVYQGQRTQELNKTALYETEKTKIANQR